MPKRSIMDDLILYQDIWLKQKSVIAINWIPMNNVNRLTWQFKKQSIYIK